ncbi:MAG TPA: hypothetical protein VL096_02075 [Pirellulaceae bacterium]|nr:hypothetical protein [Pirellulaceae bacterium]
MVARIDPPLGAAYATRRAGWRFPTTWFVLACLASLVWFAPSIVALTPLKEAIVDGAVPELHGQLRVGSVSVGWFSPVVAYNVVWRDLNGELIAEVPVLRVERSLTQLLGGASDLGTIRLQQPKLHLVLRDDGSNAEDALAALLNKPATNSAPIKLQLEVEDATAEIVDSTTQLTWRIQPLQLSLTLPGGAAAPVQGKLSGSVLDAAYAAHPFDLAYDWQATGGKATLRTDQLPLACLRPALRRVVSQADLSGIATCDVTFTHNADFSQQQLQATQVAARDLLLAAPQWLGNETLRCREFTANGQIDRAPEGLKLTDVRITSDFAQLQADGQLDPLALSSPSLLTALRTDDYQLRGQLDLAKLAAMFPQTLRVREGTEITSGLIDLELVSQSQGKKHRWDGQIKTSRLTALQNGREIVWDQPVTITLAAQQAAAGPVIERLSCEASFLKLQARGTLEQGELTATGDLAQLQAEANRFLALDDVRLAGQLGAELDWKKTGEQDFQAEGQAQIKNFVLETPARQPWQEPELTIDLAAIGIANASGLQRLDRADLRFTAGDDQLLLALLEPVATPATNTVWPIGIVLRGGLDRWLPRVQGYLPVQDWQATGQLAVDISFVSAPEELRLRSAKVDVVNLKARGAGLTIDEPELRFAADGVWNYTERRFTSDSVTLASGALALRGEKLIIVPTATAFAIAGEIGYRGDLPKLTAWWQDPRTPATRAWQGEATGRILFSHQDNITVAKCTSEFDKVALLELTQPRGATVGMPVGYVAESKWETVWKDPKLTFSGQGEFDHSRDQVKISSLDVVSNLLRIVARGQVVALSTAPTIDLSGEIAYDLANITQVLTSYIGPGITLSGASKRQFQLRGPLPTTQMVASQDPRLPAVSKLVWPADLVGQGSLAWTSINAYQLPVSAGSLDAALQDGVVSIAPLDLKVSDGRLQAWPRIVLNNDPMVFQLAKGTQVEQIQLTPEMCTTWLKFVAPLLADATRAEGKFSAQVIGATLPILAPQRGEAQATITIHGARVGPGPLSEQYVILARQVRAILERKPVGADFRADAVEWLTLPTHDVAVQLADGRVHHRGLQIQVGDTTLVTSGSVGVNDQSLAMVVEIPIREEWIAKDKLLTGLRGQSLKVPLSGTIDRPQIDNRALQQLASQMINSAAGGLIDQGIQKGLDKLFKPK